MFKARIEVRCPSRRHAEAIAESLSPDNRDVPANLKVKTESDGKSVVTIIECVGRYETFLATLDDLLTCVQTAQSSLEVL
ncbi:MAG: KEOPS complex subunit Pcc1 [Candidatus Bathyarchaeia archaeon]